MNFLFPSLLIALLGSIAGCAADQNFVQGTDMGIPSRTLNMVGQGGNVAVYHGQAIVASVDLTGPEFPESHFRVVKGVCEDSVRKPGVDLVISVGHSVSNIVARSPLDTEAMQKCRPEVAKLQKFAIDIRVQAITNNRASLLIGVKDIGDSAPQSVNTESLDLQLGEVHKIPWHQGFVSIRLKKLLLADGTEVVASNTAAAQ